MGFFFLIDDHKHILRQASFICELYFLNMYLRFENMFWIFITFMANNNNYVKKNGIFLTIVCNFFFLPSLEVESKYQSTQQLITALLFVRINSLQ